MNNIDINNITIETEKVNSPADSTPVISELPGLSGLKGGEKQHWINANLKLITTLHDNFGFEATCKACNMKAETLTKALKKAEKADRPGIRKADQAFNSAYIANEKLYRLMPEVERISDQLNQHIDDGMQLRQMLSDYFQLSAKLNSMAAQLIEKQAYNMSNFTEHIFEGKTHEVSSTHVDLTLDGIDKQNAGPSSRGKNDRLVISKDTRASARQDVGGESLQHSQGNHPGYCVKGKAGNLHYSRPAGRQRTTNRERFQNATRKKRGRRV